MYTDGWRLPSRNQMRWRFSFIGLVIQCMRRLYVIRSSYCNMVLICEPVFYCLLQSDSRRRLRGPSYISGLIAIHYRTIYRSFACTRRLPIHFSTRSVRVQVWAHAILSNEALSYLAMYSREHSRFYIGPFRGLCVYREIAESALNACCEASKYGHMQCCP